MKKTKNTTLKAHRDHHEPMDSNLFGYLSILDDPDLSDSTRQARIRSGVHQWNRHLSERRDPAQTCLNYYQHKKRRFT